MHFMNRRARRNMLSFVRTEAFCHNPSTICGDFAGAWKFWNELYNGSRRKPMFSTKKVKR